MEQLSNYKQMKNRKIKPPNLLDFLTLVLKKKEKEGEVCK